MIKVSRSTNSSEDALNKNFIGRVRTNKHAARAVEALLHNFVRSFAKQQHMYMRL